MTLIFTKPKIANTSERKGRKSAPKKKECALKTNTSNILHLKTFFPIIFSQNKLADSYKTSEVCYSDLCIQGNGNLHWSPGISSTDFSIVYPCYIQPSYYFSVTAASTTHSLLDYSFYWSLNSSNLNFRTTLTLIPLPFFHWRIPPSPLPLPHTFS